MQDKYDVIARGAIQDAAFKDLKYLHTFSAPARVIMVGSSKVAQIQH